MACNLVAVAIIKNEAPYIMEWIAFHRAIGIRNFVIYENQSSDSSERMLEICHRRGGVVVVPWVSVEGVSPQLSAYNHFLQNYAHDYEFAAFIDLDEFIVPTRENNISEVLSKVPENAGAIVMNQRVFGSSGLKEHGPGLVVERFRKCSRADYPENQFVKSIYRLSCVNSIQNVHLSPLIHGFHCYSDFSVADLMSGMPGLVRHVHFENIQLNHYIVKSWEEFGRKRSRGGGSGKTQETRLSRYSDDFFTSRNEHINSVTDGAIDRWIPFLKHELSVLEGLAVADSLDSKGRALDSP